MRFCIAAALMMPVAAMAQGNPGPFGGLFGRSAATVGEERTAVEVRASLGAQYDTSLIAPEDSPDLGTQGGFGGGATAGAGFQHQSARLTTQVSGGVSRLQNFATPSYGANVFSVGASLDSAVTTRIRVTTNVGYVHSPFFQLYQNFGGTSFVGGSVGGTRADSAVLPFAPFAAQAMENEAVQGSVGLSALLTERSGLTASASRSQTLFAKSDADFVSDGYRATWNWQVGRGLGVHAGYGREYQRQRGSLGRDFETEVVDVGVDFTRSFSLARRTSLGFSTTSSIVKSANTKQQLRINGAITLSKLFRRTWSVGASAARETSFVPGFFEPLYVDSVGASFGGMFTKRIDWMVGASGGKAETAFTKTTGFSTVTASSKLSIALYKNLGMYVQYVAYGYELPPNSNALGLPDRLARQAVSCGLSAFLPIYSKTRAAK